MTHFANRTKSTPAPYQSAPSRSASSMPSNMPYHHYMIDMYSWFIGFIDGLTLSVAYELYYTANSEAINKEKVDEGFSFGYTESIWCCDII